MIFFLFRCHQPLVLTLLISLLDQLLSFFHVFTAALTSVFPHGQSRIVALHHLSAFKMLTSRTLPISLGFFFSDQNNYHLWLNYISFGSLYEEFHFVISCFSVVMSLEISSVNVHFCIVIFSPFWYLFCCWFCHCCFKVFPTVVSHLLPLPKLDIYSNCNLFQIFALCKTNNCSVNSSPR